LENGRIITVNSHVNMISEYLKKYFWDTDIEKIDVRKHKNYVIERILEMGDERAVSWLKKNFTEKEIIGVIQKNRHLSRLSLNYWNLIFREK